ncbi:molybdate ABC transporter substrate-binding protein [Methanolobus mangrovi]|uniref:Molybdate ABC transporter substrate-binding protein n=1 Tax=Methanolobus mangrovi TaxID=3072977 RepID=A0AA51UEA1_9EURY|nr:molybdate ABC transporter substrate-binding protein [Methanolobus mangrovi]WMW21561.1 molybdate ABC transporter substrate-binding protein [Methanolobus mangrovi]
MEQSKKLILTIAAILTVVLFVSGCADTGTDIGMETEQEQITTITVSAAASLTEAFADIEEQFEDENPTIDVNFNFAGSGTLRMQIEGGAPIDVFASASQSHMDLLSNQSLIVEDSRKDFAENTVVLITPIDSQLSITKPEDLTATEVETICIGNPETAPVGKYTVEALEEAGLWDELESKTLLADDVKQVLVYVERGEVDAGFVYSTDAATSEPDTIEIKVTLPTVTPISYPIAVLSASEHQDEAQIFTDFVTSDEGRTILESYGFTA